jgi:hypothetical protein
MTPLRAPCRARILAVIALAAFLETRFQSTCNVPETALALTAGRGKHLLTGS